MLIDANGMEGLMTVLKDGAEYFMHEDHWVEDPSDFLSRYCMTEELRKTLERVFTQLVYQVSVRADDGVILSFELVDAILTQITQDLGLL